MLRPAFKPDKATQLTVILLEHFGGTMDRYPLLKLIWLVERTSFERSGRPICYDDYVSMNEGLLPSRTYDLIKGAFIHQSWMQAIETQRLYSVRVKTDAVVPDVLSEYERETIQIAINKYGNQPSRVWRERAHDLPLWKGKHYPNTSVTVEYDEILRDVGLGDYLDDIKSDMEAARQLETM